jgi:hypothetical protein
VRSGRLAVLKGTLAVPVDGTSGASVVWAAPGTLVTVQRKTGRVWVPVKPVQTGANGVWRAAVRVRSTSLWRAVAQASPDLAFEFSLVKRTAVTR